MESYSNAHMERGKQMEGEAREYYAFTRNVEPVQIGFVKNGHRAGCSPDALLDDDGLLEIKTKLPHLLIPLLQGDGSCPPEHKAQCQGALWVTGRRWLDLVIYWPSMPMLVVRVGRDEGYIANLIGEVRAFNAELDEVVAFVRSWGAP